jgi:RNA polymerase sigma factor (sigma-70 family)
MSLYDPKNPRRAIVLPESQPAEDRDAFVRSLTKEHSDFVLEVLRRRRDLQPASAEDVQQRVLVIFDRHLAKQAEAERMIPEQVERFLRGVIKKEVGNYTRGRSRGLPGGADADVVISPALDPERAAALAEHRAKIARYLDQLSRTEAAVVRYIDLEGMMLKEAAERLGLPPGTVSTTHIRARKKLRELAIASRRATALAGSDALDSGGR